MDEEHLAPLSPQYPSGETNPVSVACLPVEARYESVVGQWFSLVNFESDWANLTAARCSRGALLGRSDLVEGEGSRDEDGKGGKVEKLHVG